MKTISVVIITYNEAKNIARCINSVKAIADEIVVVDSFSSDDTLKIAELLGAKTYKHPFSGYVAQKNKALELATHDYVLCLDADEQLSEQLIESIKRVKNDLHFVAYSFSRCAYYRGKFIKYGTWYPERKIRLFDKRSLKWTGDYIHEQVIAKQGMAVYPLTGDILHFICDSRQEHTERSNNFSNIAAMSMFKKGKRASWVKMLASPAWFFLVDYFFRRGFMNGWRGLAIATEQSRYHYLKYKKLRALYNDKNIEKYKTVERILNIKPSISNKNLIHAVNNKVQSRFRSQVVNA